MYTECRVEHVNFSFVLKELRNNNTILKVKYVCHGKKTVFKMVSGSRGTKEGNVNAKKGCMGLNLSHSCTYKLYK